MEVEVAEVLIVITVGISISVVDRREAEGDAVVRDIWRTAKSDQSNQARHWSIEHA